jgi:hypothetical protein
MFHLMRAAGLLVFPAVLALPLAAQPAPAAPAQPAPAPLGYRSAFEGYQAFGDEKPVPWKDANDAVRAIGGWRAYAKEAQASQPAAQPAPTPTPTPTDPHAGHGKH